VEEQMNNHDSKNLVKPARALLTVAAVCGLILACTKGGSISGGGGGGSTSSGVIAVTLVYPTASGPAWVPIVSSNTTFVKGLLLTAVGTCARGINTVKVDEGGPVLSNITCASDGSFIWNYDFTGDEGTKTLNFNAFDLSGNAVAGSTITKLVRVDNTPPSNPVITTPDPTQPVSSTPGYDSVTNVYSGPLNIFPMAGTCDITGAPTGGCDHLIGPAGVKITVNQTTGIWTYNATLADGGTTLFSFNAYDLAGNASGTVTQTIIYHPTIQSVASTYTGNGDVADNGGSGITLEPNGYVFGSDSNNTVTDLVTGFNYLTNLLRGL
jgi:hypothetical protein